MSALVVSCLVRCFNTTGSAGSVQLGARQRRSVPARRLQLRDRLRLDRQVDPVEQTRGRLQGLAHVACQGAAGL